MVQNIQEAAARLRELYSDQPASVVSTLNDHLLGVGRVEALRVNYHGSSRNAEIAATRFEVHFGMHCNKHSATFAHVTTYDHLSRCVLGHAPGEDPSVQQINIRQITMVCTDHLAKIARRMNLPDDQVSFGMQHENIVVSGIDLAMVPAGSTMVFLTPEGVPRPVSLFVTGPVEPCETPGDTIRAHYGAAVTGRGRFKEIAYGIRGITLMVKCAPVRGAFLAQGDYMGAFAPGV